MDGFSTLVSCFEVERDKFLRTPLIQSIMSGDVRTSHYAQMMRQVFHQARENPQLQALATVRLRGTKRDAVSLFYRHAASEVGHDALALADYATCGFDPGPIPAENPHPATTAVTSFAFHQIYNLNPVGYLGYLFFLEFLPTSVGGGMIAKLKAAGVPEGAFTFLNDHVTVDVGHNKAMEKYCAMLLLDESDMESALYALRTTAYLYTNMLTAAASQGDQPLSYGVASHELKNCA